MRSISCKSVPSPIEKKLRNQKHHSHDRQCQNRQVRLQSHGRRPHLLLKVESQDLHRPPQRLAQQIQKSIEFALRGLVQVEDTLPLPNQNTSSHFLPFC